jgi:hypothetical protein
MTGHPLFLLTLTLSLPPNAVAGRWERRPEPILTKGPWVWFSFNSPSIDCGHDSGSVMLKKQKRSCMEEQWEGGGGEGWTAESKILEKLFTLCREGVK